MRIIQKSKLKIQYSTIPNAQCAQFKIQNSKFKTKEYDIL